MTNALSIVPVMRAITIRLVAGCLLLSMWVLSMLPAAAQNTNAIIRGEVLDRTGASVPGAHLLITSKSTGVVAYSGTSGGSGAFVAPEILPGAYEIVAEAPGFRRLQMDNIVVTVAQVLSLVLNLDIGARGDIVVISARNQQLESSSSEISTLITPAEVQNIPLYNRTAENLLALIPGVTHGGPGDQANTSQLSINGSRTLNSEMLLNGISLIIASTGSAVTLPSPDGIDQFRLLATNAPAEYGRTAGAILSVNTNSGSTHVHGNLYYLMRNEFLDANSYFNNLKLVNGTPTPRAKDRYFQFGGSVGGPVFFPRVSRGPARTFFFVNYDYTISPSVASFTDTVPEDGTRTQGAGGGPNSMPNQRAGDLSNAAQAWCLSPTQCRTPYNIYKPGGTATAAFPGDKINTPLDAAAANILGLLPRPNTPGTYDLTNNRYTGNWITQQNTTTHTTRFVVRVDEQLSDSNRFSVNLYRYNSSSPNAVNYNQDESGTLLDFAHALFNTTWDCSCSNAWLPSVDYTHVWTPTLVMDVNMGFLRYATYRKPPGTGLNASATLGVSSLPLDQMPQLTSPGFSNLGADTNTHQANVTNTYTPFGSVTKTYGAHTFKIGASLRKNQFNSFNPASSPEGSLSFDGSITNHGNAGNANTGLADFELGQIKTGSYEQPMPPTGRRNWNLGLYFQDDVRETERLTLNLGLRWEYESPLTVAHDLYSRFDPDSGQMLVAGRNASRALNIATPRNDFSPRIGIAFSLDKNTVLRAAFGTFFGTIFQNLGGQVAFPGYDNNVSYTNRGTAIAQPFRLAQGFPLVPGLTGNDPRSAPLYTNATDASPYSISGVDFNYMRKMPVVTQWNAGFQRSLPLALTLEVNYVGNHAVHLPYIVPYNIVPLSAVDAATLANTTKATQDAKPYPTLSSWSSIDHVGNANYNALQITVRRDFRQRLALLSNYTFAKSMDDGSTIYNFSAPFGTANAQYTATGESRARDFAVSNIDVAHTLNIVMVYTTSGPRWLRNWHLSPVFVGHTGLPVNITQTNEISNVTQQRPNGDTRGLKLAKPYLNGPALQYFAPATDYAGFPLSPSGPVYAAVNGTRTRLVPTGFGDVPRDSSRAPGEIDFDASISKDFDIWRELRLQIRVDGFNVINHTNFTQPNTALTVTTTTANDLTAVDFRGSAGFGQITGTQPNRKLQGSARIFF